MAQARLAAPPTSRRTSPTEFSRSIREPPSPGTGEKGERAFTEAALSRRSDRSFDR